MRSSIGQVFLYTVLGVFSGIPLAFVSSMLQLWFAQADIALKTIGILSMVTMPYSFKFLWVPLVENYYLGSCSYRFWMLIFGLLTGAVMCIMSTLNPVTHAVAIVALAIALSFCSASFDSMLDGYRLKYVNPSHLGKNSSAVATGYRLGMLITAGGGTIAADYLGFSPVYAFFGMVFISGVIFLYAFLERVDGFRKIEPESKAKSTIQVMIQSLSALKDINSLGLVLIILATYRFCDTLLGSLTSYFLYDVLGYSLLTIGSTAKIIGPMATLFGGVIGGFWIDRAGIKKTMFSIGLLQAISNLSFIYLFYSKKSVEELILVVGIESFFGGLANSALVVFLSNIALQCKRHRATCYALLASTFSFSRAYSGLLASYLVENFGWVIFISVTALVVIVPLSALYAYESKMARRKADLVQEERTAAIN